MKQPASNDLSTKLSCRSNRTREGHHQKMNIENENEDSEAEPLQELLCDKTAELVGWLYQWEDGGLQVMWSDERKNGIALGRVINPAGPYSRSTYLDFVNAVKNPTKFSFWETLV